MTSRVSSRLGGAGPLLVLVAAVAAWVLWPSLSSLQKTWAALRDYEHGYLIVAISAGWLLLVARRHWVTPAQPSAAGMGLLAVALLLWLVGFNANSQIVHQLLMPLVVGSAVLAACGWKVSRDALVPVAFLYFAVPIWDSLVPMLQRVSIFATETILAVMGVPAHVSEYTVSIPEGTFQIVEGCSGKRYLIVTLAMAVLAASLNHLPRWRFAGFVAIAGGLALVANWVRIVVVIYAGHVSDMQHYLVAVEHDSLGNVIFVLLLGVVFLLARRLGRDTVVPASPEAIDLAGRPAVFPWPAIVPFVLLGSFTALLQWRADVTPAPCELGNLPVTTGTWQGPLPPAPAWSPRYVDPDSERRASYRSATGSVEIYVNAYSDQRQGRELVFYGNTLLAPGPWQRSWPLQVQTLASRDASLAAFEARAPDGSLWLVAHVYEVGGWTTTRDPLAQLRYGIGSILGPLPAGVVALAAPCDTKCDVARTLVTTFWDDMSARILGVVPDERRDP